MKSIRYLSSMAQADTLPASVLDVIKRIPADRRDEFRAYVNRRRSRFTQEPIGLEQFVADPSYLNKANQIYPRVLEALIEINSGSYQEAILTGAIGVAKSTIAIYSMAYQLYRLSCLKSPHLEFDLDPSSEIVIIFQSLNERLAKAVDYLRFKSLIDGSPYFRQCCPYDRKVESELRFPNRIIVKPVAGNVAGAIGQNVIGGVIDEVNYMERVGRSKRSLDNGEYDQATALYNSIARRRKSRFMRKGELPGLLCLVSSKRYPGQFTDNKVKEAEQDPTIYVYDRRTWEILPEDRFSGKWFKVFIGDQTRQPRIIGEDDPNCDDDFVLEVPVEYRDDFERDIHEALREIGGISTMATHPFLANREAVSWGFGRRKSLFNKTEIFSDEKLLIFPKRFEDREQPRLAHLDLALTGDSAGLCIGYVKKFVDVSRGDRSAGKMPLIYIDGALRINPPRNGEINFERLRNILFRLRDNGLNIRFVTFDSFQSRDSIQILRGQGFLASLTSVDKTPLPYDVTKSALYENRVLIPKDDGLLNELLALEYDTQKGRVDHPPNGSKDVADSLAGVVYGCTWARYFWTIHGVSPTQAPISLRKISSEAGRS